MTREKLEKNKKMCYNLKKTRIFLPIGTAYAAKNIPKAQIIAQKPPKKNKKSLGCHPDLTEREVKHAKAPLATLQERKSTLPGEAPQEKR